MTVPYGSKGWTPADDELLRKLVLEDYARVEIATELKRSLVVRKVSNLIWLFRETCFSQPINQVLHVFCAFENGYPFLGAANAVSWI